MEAPDDGIMGHMNTELFPKLTQPQTQGSLCNDLEAFCKVHGLPFMSADELMLSEGVDKDQRDWLSDFVEAWEAVMGQANEGKVELRTPVELAGAFVSALRDALEPEQFTECVAGRLDPDAVCDSNVVMASAFLRLHRRDPILPSQVEEGLFSEAEAEAERALWNEAVELVSACGVGIGHGR